MLENEGRKRTVIVVDDCEDIRLLLRAMLEMRGFAVHEAEHGREAIELAKLKCPDLILMDLNMPILDGLAATRALRELKELCQMPIIAVSANSKDAAEDAALAAGCNAYLVKPVDIKQFDYLLHTLLNV